MMKINRTPNPFCPACGKNRTITKIETFTMENKNAIDLNIHDIPKEEFSHYQLLDIREADERRQEPVMRRDCLTYPFSTFEKESFPFEREKKYLIFCSKGGRSHRMVEVLREQGITNTFSVINGVASVNAYFKKY